MLYRDGPQIRVFSIYPPFYRDPSREVVCTGPPPTVTNVDRVEVIPRDSAPKALIVNQSGERLATDDGTVVPANPGGPLSPGATREPRGSEIEVSVAPTSRKGIGTSVWFIGGSADDGVTAGRLSGGGVGLNLNVSADGPSPDVDVFGGTASYGIVLRGFAGDDRLGARGGPGFATGLWKKAAVVIQGGTGDDRLFGHPGYDTLVGDRGNDLIRAGRGSDGFRGGTALVDGPGRDRVYGGPGRDELGDPTTSHDGSHGADHMFGGPGADTFYERDGARDVLNCGPGLEQDVQFDRFDVLRACASRQYQRS
jgi:Ca2+-binding RTX toxin-like protein